MIVPGMIGVGFPESGFDPAAFVLSVKTDNTGTSNSDQFTLPLFSGQTYDFTVSYDGNTVTHNTDSDLTLTFPSGAGTYDVTITGTFPAIRFNNGGDKLKVLELKQWGTGTWTTLERAFLGCTNMEITATDHATAGTGSVTSMLNAFYNSGITSFPEIDTSSVVVFTNAFRGSLLQSFPGLDVGAGVFFIGTFQGCTGLDGYDFPTLDMSAMTDGTDCFNGVTLSTASWSDLLVYVEANNADTDFIFNGGNSKHNAAGAAAIAALEGRSPGCTVEDGGLE